MLWDWMSRPLSFLLLFHLPSSHNVFLHILYFSLSFLHIPSFLTFTYVYLFVTFDLLLISPFLHVFYAFLLFSFFLLIFFPSQPLSSSSLLFYLFHCLLLFLPPFLSFTTFCPSFSSSFQNPSPPHPSWIHILAINNGSEIEQADKTYRQRVFFNDMLKYYHIYGMWTEYDIIHQIHEYYLE